MNRNLKDDLEEKSIRKLFAEMRAADEQTGPSFSDVRRHPETPEISIGLGRSAQIAAAIAILILISAGAIAYLRQPRSNQSATEVKVKDNPIVVSQPKIPENRAPDIVKSPKRVVNRITKKMPRRQDILLSQWHSPTEFLLRTPGNELLKTVPRLDDSRLKINSTMPNDLN